MLEAFLFVIALLALGKACAALRLLPENAGESLNLFVLYLCLPAAVLLYAPKLQLGPGVLGVAAVPWLVLLASAALVQWLATALRLRDDERAVLLLCVPLGNTSFLGYPLIRAMLGEDALPHAVIYDQFGSFLILSTWGLWVLARYGGDAKPTARTLAAKIVRFPPFVALVFALTLMPADPPPMLAAALQRLADALLPVVAFAVGLGLRLRLPRGELAPLGVGIMLKLAALPLLAFGLVTLLGLDTPAAPTAVLETAMPPMITAGALAISHRLAPTLAAALIGYGTLLSMATLPVWRMMSV
jgi:predicted permease